MMHYGYCKLKKENQSTDSQYETLLKNGIPPENIFKDTVVGQSKRLPEYNNLMSGIKAHDSLTIVDIDILGQTLEKRLITIYQLSKKGILLTSINDNFDARLSSGKFFVSVLAKLGEKEFNREKPERTMEGLKEARQRGFKGGRPEGLSPEAEIIAQEVKRLYREEKKSRTYITNLLKISNGTFYNYLRHQTMTNTNDLTPNTPKNNVE